jgi:hypothetical protein
LKGRRFCKELFLKSRWIDCRKKGGNKPANTTGFQGGFKRFKLYHIGHSIWNCAALILYIQIESNEPNRSFPFTGRSDFLAGFAVAVLYRWRLFCPRAKDSRWLGASYAPALAYLALKTTSLKDAFLTGAAVYAVYDFTLMTVFKDYNLGMAVADTLWGGTLFTMTRYVLDRFKF